MKKLSMLIAVIITFSCFQLNTISFASGDVATSDITFSSSEASGGTVAKMTVTSNPEAHTVALIAGKYDKNKLTAVSIDKTSSVSQAELEAVIPTYPVSDTAFFAVDLTAGVKPLKSAIHVGTQKLLDEDFEESIPFVVAKRTSIIEQFAESDGTKSVLFERKGQEDFHMDCYSVASYSDVVVYEFDICFYEVTSSVQVNLKDTNAKYSVIANIRTNGSVTLGNYNFIPQKQRYYTIRAVYDYSQRKRDFYLGEALVSRCDIDAEFAISGALPELMRVHVHSTSSPEKYPVKFTVDNIKAYDSPAVLSDLSYLDNDLNIARGDSVFEDESALTALLKGYNAIHARSGVVYIEGKKRMLSNLPVTDGDAVLVPVEELGSHYDAKITLFGTSATVNGTTFTTQTINGVSYADYVEFFGALGKKVYTDNSCINAGMIITGDLLFEPPDDANMLQALNDYLFYIRPDRQTVLKAFNAKSASHPRIQATKADFERIKNEISLDSYKKSWYTTMMYKANDLVKNDTEPLKYELRDGVRLLHVARDALTNMYVLGMAYRITGEQKYADRAWIDLEAVCSFADWHPEHDIDVGEMCAAVAIGYDWLYDTLDSDQRKHIEEAIYNNGFYPAVLGYQSRKGPLKGSLVCNFNHNVVLNGGIIMAALAVMDVYPDEASYIVANGVRASEEMFWRYAPEGAWFEGPHYWEYAMQYTAKLISTLQSALGTAYCLDMTEGLCVADRYILGMQTDKGIFNYSDGSDNTQYVPEIFWLSNTYGNPDTTASLMALSGGTMANNEDKVLALLWYDTSSFESDEIDLPLDNYYPSHHTVTMRDSWASSKTTFAGVHAGLTNHTHAQLDAGSFIYEYGGVRWAIDPGMTPYDLPEAADYSEYGKRWNMFRSRAESHNTIVVNPSSGPDHKVSATVPITSFESDADEAITIVDMTPAFGNVTEVTNAKRGIYFTDSRKSLVIRDEIELNAASTVYWFMQTKATVSQNGNKLILTQSGKTVELEFVTNCDFEVSYAPAAPLPTSPVVENDNYGTGITRIAIKFSASDAANITVKLTPTDIENASFVDEYNTNINSWVLKL